MAVYTSDESLDAYLNVHAASTQMCACSAQPTTYYEGCDPNAWAATTAYSLNAAVRPTARNGFVYQCTTAGTSSGTEPTWPTTAGGSVTDGTVVWTCRVNYSVAAITLSGADFTLSDNAGAGLGRKLTRAAKSGITITGAGTPTITHCAYLTTASLKLNAVQTTTATVVANGGNLTFTATNFIAKDTV